jgi:hypothetical protein
MPLGSHAPRWARRVASGDALRGILAVIRRDAGAPMPGPFASPDCELVLPSATPGAFRVLHVVFDGAFVRCFPDGLDAPGLIYPVEDAPGLRRIVGALPALDVIR